MWIDRECIRITQFCERAEDRLESRMCLENVWEFILDFLRRRMDKCRIPSVHNEYHSFLEASFHVRSRADFFIWLLNFEEALTTLLRQHRTAVL
jgi:hypothetical protein